MLINLDQATKLLQQGSIVAIPTETVYGLAASLNNEDAIRQIFISKNRPPDNPLIIHISCKDQLTFIESYPKDFDLLITHFWPGPLTLILPLKQSSIPSIVTAGLQTVGVRVPNHPLALQLIQKTGPLVAPSANISGKPSGTHPSHIESDFGPDFPVLDGGQCTQGLESTILFPTENGWKIVRHGAVSAESLQQILGYSPLPTEQDKLEWTQNKTPVAPGQKYRHYAPKAKLILGKVYKNEPIVLGFTGRGYKAAQTIIHLGDLQEPERIAANLYVVLRHLDYLGLKEVWVDCDFPQDGIFRTIHERLERAAT